ncbi:MAG: hypothetical protein ACRDQ4_07220 [Pseudonocardiaceae bacterium]
MQYRGSGRFTETDEGTTVTVATDLTAGRAVATCAVPVITGLALLALIIRWWRRRRRTQTS